ncbi:hypothetical protein M0804_009856 [Polistes exclamans]|nr:hypothetical protein M0804_009856 [Polistes exclamans]
MKFSIGFVWTPLSVRNRRVHAPFEEPNDDDNDYDDDDDEDEVEDEHTRTKRTGTREKEDKRGWFLGWGLRVGLIKKGSQSDHFLWFQFNSDVDIFRMHIPGLQKRLPPRG